MVTELIDYKAHEYADAFPFFDENIDDLAADIKTNGLLHPIVLHEDKILDGRHRYAACKRAGVEPRTRSWDGECGDPLSFVISQNVKRYHWNESQRAMVAARIENMQRGRPGKDADLRVNREQASALMGVGTRNTCSAAKVQRKGTPKLQKAIDDGKATVWAAKDLCDAPPEVQDRAVDEGTVSKEAKRIRGERRRAEKETEMGATTETVANAGNGKYRKHIPSAGMAIAYKAVKLLEEIRDNDTQRKQAMNYVAKWLKDHK